MKSRLLIIALVGCLLSGCSFSVKGPDVASTPAPRVANGPAYEAYQSVVNGADAALSPVPAAVNYEGLPDVSPSLDARYTNFECQSTDPDSNLSVGGYLVSDSEIHQMQISGDNGSSRPVTVTTNAEKDCRDEAHNAHFFISDKTYLILPAHSRFAYEPFDAKMDNGNNDDVALHCTVTQPLFQAGTAWKSPAKETVSQAKVALSAGWPSALSYDEAEKFCTAQGASLPTAREMALLQTPKFSEFTMPWGAVRELNQEEDGNEYSSSTPQGFEENSLCPDLKEGQTNFDLMAVENSNGDSDYFYFDYTMASGSTEYFWTSSTLVVDDGNSVAGYEPSLHRIVYNPNSGQLDHEKAAKDKSGKWFVQCITSKPAAN